MEKELKSCTGVLLRADLTGHGHPTCFGRKGLDLSVLFMVKFPRKDMMEFISLSELSFKAYL